jgi:hypothetical protein
MHAAGSGDWWLGTENGLWRVCSTLIAAQRHPNFADSGIKNDANRPPLVAAIAEDNFLYDSGFVMKPQGWPEGLLLASLKRLAE